MNILATQYSLNQKSLDIYISGCRGNPHCEGCHNPETWNFNLGIHYTKDYLGIIKDKINNFNDLIDNIMIFGGEPNDQNQDELLHFLMDLKMFNKKIWLFTRYNIMEIPKFEYVLCDYIKCGRYIPNLITNENIKYGIKLATSNQKIYKKGLNY